MKLTKDIDIVYILRNDIEPQELRYSLRSLKNFPHGKVWFFGGEPAYLRADGQKYVAQRGDTPWSRVSYTLRQVCEDNDVTEDFWLFNDDFFVMKPLQEYVPRYNGTLMEHVAEVEARHGGHPSAYTAELRQTAKALEAKGYDTKNYACHVPILINREKALKTLNEFPFVPMFRSLYGNQFDIGGVNLPDVKIAVINKEPDHEAELLSTADNSWLVGKIGAYIREQFPEPCRYEEDLARE